MHNAYGAIWKDRLLNAAKPMPVLGLPDPEPPTRRQVLRACIDVWREKLALKIAPWLKDNRL